MPATRRGVYRLYQWLWCGLDWFYPPNCGGCDRRGARWCGDCQKGTQILGSLVCPICGRPQTTDKLCTTCTTEIPKYTQLRSWALFQGTIRQAVHRLKYKRDVSLGVIFSRFMIELLERFSWDIDLVIPVPLGVARLVERGYNQATLLARPLSLAVNKPFSSRALIRARDTVSQVNLNISERKRNVKGAFLARNALVNGKQILVVDDVATSGSTINECASALLDAGADRVYGLTLARTPL